MRQRNRTIFTGTFKSILRRPSFRRLLSSIRITKVVKLLEGGPMHGVKLYMSDTSSTLPFTYKGQTGRYLDGKWHPSTPPTSKPEPTIMMETETA